jgi:hypothetical protein
MQFYLKLWLVNVNKNLSGFLLFMHSISNDTLFQANKAIYIPKSSSDN